MMSSPDSDYVDWDKLSAEVRRRFQLPLDSIHGPSHWRRVENIGVTLAVATQADLTVVRLFALLHDAMRQTEELDEEHGQRAAALAGELRGQVFHISDNQFKTLWTACAEHNDGRTSREQTIGTCWDADRLELARLGIRPKQRYLSTNAAKDLTIQEWAWELAGEERDQDW